MMENNIFNHRFRIFDKVDKGHGGAGGGAACGLMIVRFANTWFGTCCSSTLPERSDGCLHAMYHGHKQPGAVQGLDWRPTARTIS